MLGLNRFVETWTKYQVGGAIVAWPVTHGGRCGAQCGRVCAGSVYGSCARKKEKEGELLKSTKAIIAFRQAAPSETIKY